MDFGLPKIEDEQELKDFLQEHFDNGETSVLLMQDLFLHDFVEWVNRLHRYATEGNGKWGRSLMYFCRDGDKVIGTLCIRYELTAELESIYGNIGYYVRPSERRKGYATKMLRKGLDVCKDFGLTKVTVGCYRANIASAKVITKCGGILIAENDNYEKGKLSQYYEIRLHS